MEINELNKLGAESFLLPPFEHSDLTCKYPSHMNLKDPELKVYRLRNVLVNEFGYVMLESGEIIDSGYPHDKEKSYSQFRSVDLANVPDTLESAVLVYGHNNYYHWHLNWFPRLFLAKRFSVTRNSYFLINKSPSRFIYDSICTFSDIELSRVLKMESSFIKVKELFLPELFLNPMHSPYALRNFQKRKMLTGKKRRIFLSRKKAKFRTILNEDEVVNLLEKYNFELFTAESMTYVEQVSIFSQAEIIVTPHGAGLTNMIFCTPGFAVLELFNEYYSKVFWSLAVVFGAVGYKTMQSSNVSPPEDFRDEVEKTKNSDFHVDLFGLEKNVKNLIGLVTVNEK